MASPRVSIIMPTCERPQLLRRAVLSVLNQTEPDLELLVINDGVTDVRPVLAAFGDARIHLIDQTGHRGQSAARNTGLKAARGEYIAYLDDDDTFYPEHLATLLAAAQPTGAAYADAWRVFRDEQGRETRRDQPFSQDFDRDLLLVTNYIPLPCLLHSRSLIDSCGGFDENLTQLEDWDLIIRLARCCDFKRIKAITAEYNKTRGQASVTRRGQDKSLEVTEQIHERYREFADDETRKAQLRRSAILKIKLGGQSRYSNAALAAQLVDDGEKCYTAGAIEQARFFLASALKLDPQNGAALSDLGVLAWQAGQTDAAIEIFTRVLLLEPGQVDALANLVSCLELPHSTRIPADLYGRLKQAGAQAELLARLATLSGAS